MEQRMKNEKATRIRILRDLGMNERQCKRMEEDEFVLLGYTVTPRPEYNDCRKLKEGFEKEYDAIVLFGLLNVTEGYSEMGGIRFAFNEDGFPVRTA